jgi:Transposase domain (DUF772)
MLIVGYCYGLRSERKLTQEVELHLAYRWFCRLDLDDKVPIARGTNFYPSLFLKHLGHLAFPRSGLRRSHRVGSWSRSSERDQFLFMSVSKKVSRNGSA